MHERLQSDSTPELAELKQRACASIDRLRNQLLDVSHGIHANPELAFVEHGASALLCETLTHAGLPTEPGAYGLETAFETELGPEGAPRIALLAEYDALPGIGHACGHNLIATAALGAALALHELGSALPARVRLLGTPAEEHGGGKELMARAGAFEQVDAALMIHPSGINLATMPCLAIAEVVARYQGRAAHASAMPARGINALDALVLAYQAIGALRQHIQPTERIHGIITDGGRAPNIVPDRAAGSFYVRARDARALAALKERVEGCFRAGAAATGAELELEWGAVDYLDLNTNQPLAERFQANAEALGRRFFPLEKLPSNAQGSTDMGNVSWRVPSIHPMLAAAPPNVTIHHPDFTHFAGSESGDAAALDGAKALAMTALDFACDAGLRERVREAFEAARRSD